MTKAILELDHIPEKSMMGTCNCKISLTDVLHEEREKLRPNHLES